MTGVGQACERSNQETAQEIDGKRSIGEGGQGEVPVHDAERVAARSGIADAARAAGAEVILPPGADFVLAALGGAVLDDAGRNRLLLWSRVVRGALCLPLCIMLITSTMPPMMAASLM